MIQSLRNVGIVGLGVCLPENRLTNFDLEKMVNTTDEWIKTMTGISERRIADKNVTSSSLGAKAAKNALKDAGVSAEDIDLIIVATASPDMYFPSTACIIQDIIGAKNAAAFDISAACSGFVYALNTASQFILTGFYKNALVIGAETLSKVVDWEDRNTCILFGDGAGAAVIKQVENGYGILSTTLGSDGSLGRCLTVPACYADDEEIAKRNPNKEKTIWMNGKEVFKFAVKILEKATKEALNAYNLKVEDVDMIIPHQANIRIINSASERLGIPKEKFYTNLDKYGNSSAASVPIALFEAYKEGKIKKGQIIVLVAFGGGLTWGSTVIKWNI